jgi:hypothetical protein
MKSAEVADSENQTATASLRECLTPFLCFKRVVIAEFLFVFLDTAIQFVGERVDRGIHVVMDGVGVQLSAAQINGCLGFMTEFFYGQYAVHVHYMIRVTHDAIEFFFHVAF